MRPSLTCRMNSTAPSAYFFSIAPLSATIFAKTSGDCISQPITPARKFRMLLHINPTRQRGKRTGSLAGASGWYMTFFAAGVIVKPRTAVAVVASKGNEDAFTVPRHGSLPGAGSPLARFSRESYSGGGGVSGCAGSPALHRPD